MFEIPYLDSVRSNDKVIEYFISLAKYKMKRHFTDDIWKKDKRN